jgi:hypothetical protein
MSRYVAFRRQPVDGQVAQQLRTITIPAPTRGIVQSENQSYMQPGGAVVQDNWAPTMRGVKLRGGYVRWCDLHALDVPVWVTSHAYAVGNLARDTLGVWKALVAHTSAATGVFADDRTLHPDYWVVSSFPLADPTRKPIISGFEYVTSTQQRMFAANDTSLFDVTAADIPTLVNAGHGSGNYTAAQYTNAETEWLLAVNDAGDPVLRFNGVAWTVLDPIAIVDWVISTHYAVGALTRDATDGTYWINRVDHTSGTSTFAAERLANPGYWDSDSAPDGAAWITGPPDSAVENGHGLTHVCKYRNRLFFIEGGSMNAWYLGIDSIGGVLKQIPLSGAATKGGSLLFSAVWSLDAGDGADDKLVFFTDIGETLVFTGTNPSEVTSWRQEGRYTLAAPLGKNAHVTIGGDLLVMTTDGIIPISQAITKEAGQLELAMLTRTIKPLWRQQVVEKRHWAWSAKRWDDYGGAFVTTPGGRPGERFCLVANNVTGAWCRFTNYDATCFMLMRNDLYFGTQDGIVMQSERTGYDDGNHAKTPFIATLVGGWEMFGAPSAHVVWRQSRAMFLTNARQPPLQLQLAATVNYGVVVPHPLPPVPDPDAGGLGLADVWDEGLYGPVGSGHPKTPTPAEMHDYAQWDNRDDELALRAMVARSSLWISIGQTGFAHAPIVQITIAQQARPVLELIATSVVYEPAGINVD